MAAIILPRRTGWVPQGAVQLSNRAIDRGLERIYVPGIAPRLLSPYGPITLNTFSNHALTQYPRGHAGAFNGVSTNLCENKSPIGDSFRGTMFALCYSAVSGTSATGCVISLSKNGAANPLFRLIGTGSGISPNGRFMAQLRNAAGGATTNLSGTTSSNPEIVAGTPYLVVLTCEGGSGSGANAARLYVNGAEVASGTAPIEDVMGRDRFTIGGMNRSGFENPWNGGIVLAGVGSEPLTGAEVAELYANPGMLLREPTRRIWVTSSVSSGTTISPSAGALAYTGYAASITQPRTITSVKGALTYTGKTPGVVQAAPLSPATGSLTYSGYAPVITQPQTIAGVVGHLAFAGKQPTVLVSQGITATTGHLAYTGKTPTVSQPHTVSPATGHVTYSGYRPSIPGLLTVSAQGRAGRKLIIDARLPSRDIQQLVVTLYDRVRETNLQVNGLTEQNPDYLYTATDTAPTADSRPGMFVPKRTKEELGTTGQKYVLHGWDYVKQGSAYAWVERRTLTGN